MFSDTELPSTRPYLIRALYDWCSENGFTPYVAVKVDGSVQVPREFVQGGEIVLNISFDATSNLQLGNDAVTFNARFGGQPFALYIPVNAVLAIYARENGAGTVFTLEEEEDEAEIFSNEFDDDSPEPEPPKPKKASHLKVVK